MEHNVQSDLLTNWDQIAAVVARTPRTAQLWAKTRGLPVRYPHGKGYPVASRQELLQWLGNGSGTKGVAADDRVAALHYPAPISPDRERGKLSQLALLTDSTAQVQSSVVEASAVDVKSRPLSGPRHLVWMISLSLASLLAVLIVTRLSHRIPAAPLSVESERLYQSSWALVKEKREGAWLQVAAMMDTALQGQPGQPELHQLRGIAYRSMGLNERAIEDLTAAISARPKNGLSFYNRGSAYNALGEYRKAIADQDKAIQLAPTDPSRDLFYQERGIAFKKLGRSEHDRSLILRALADFNEVLKLNPLKGYAWHERGSVWISLEEPIKALADFNTAEGLLSPENRYWLYRDRADVKQRLGDYQGASADRKRSDQVTEKR